MVSRRVLGVLRVLSYDLQDVELGSELAVDAVYKSQSAPHEEQIVRDTADARA
jgi:hypothetical protein